MYYLSHELNHEHYLGPPPQNFYFVGRKKEKFWWKISGKILQYLQNSQLLWLPRETFHFCRERDSSWLPPPAGSSLCLPPFLQCFRLQTTAVPFPVREGVQDNFTIAPFQNSVKRAKASPERAELSTNSFRLQFLQFILKKDSKERWIDWRDSPLLVSSLCEMRILHSPWATDTGSLGIEGVWGVVFPLGQGKRCWGSRRGVCVCVCFKPMRMRTFESELCNVSRKPQTLHNHRRMSEVDKHFCPSG